MNIWNLLCSAHTHVTPSVDNCHKFAILAFHMKGMFFIPSVINSVLFTSYFNIFLLVVVFAFLHSSFAVLLVIRFFELT